MSCLKCPYVVAAGQLSIPPAALAAEPMLNLLCVDHFRELTAARLKAAERAAYEASRRWCSCGNEIYFDGADRTRSSCSRCELRVQPAVAVPAGTDVSTRVEEGWYRKAPCETEGCTKTPYKLPSGAVLCTEHGAPSKGGTLDESGRS